MATSPEASARQPDAPSSAQRGGYSRSDSETACPTQYVKDCAHRGENWRRFQRDWKIYERAAKITRNTKTTLIEKVLEQFRNRLVPVSNETFERYKFFKRNQEPEEMINAYVTAVMKLAIWRLEGQPHPGPSGT